MLKSKLSVAVGGMAVLVALSGCGGSAIFVRPVATTATLTQEPGAAAKLNMIVVPAQGNPSASDRCDFDRVPTWCSKATGELRFDVQPSRTLYYLYLRNEGPENTLAVIKIYREGKEEGRSSIFIQAGTTERVFELGIETVKRVAGN